MTGLLVEIALLLCAIGVFLIALEVGYRLGRRQQAKTDEPDKTHVNALHGAVLGLLALLLGFTFAMAVSRYETRKTLIVDQANAIGTASLRGRLLPQPYAQSTVPLIRDYTESRFQYFAAGRNDAAIADVEARANNIENQLWEIGRVVMAEDPHSQPGALYIQALNDMFDLREKRRFALGDRVPAAVTFMLFIVSFAAMGLVSYSGGLTGRRHGYANSTFACLIALVLIIILDIDAPRAGLVTVSQESLIRLQQSLPAP